MSMVSSCSLSQLLLPGKVRRAIHPTHANGNKMKLKAPLKTVKAYTDDEIADIRSRIAQGDNDGMFDGIDARWLLTFDIRRNDSCPCKHTTPCDPRCTCVLSISSSGCLRCCAYGTPEQQQAAAQHLAAVGDKITALDKLLDIERAQHKSERDRLIVMIQAGMSAYDNATANGEYSRWYNRAEALLDDIHPAWSDPANEKAADIAYNCMINMSADVKEFYETLFNTAADASAAGMTKMQIIQAVRDGIHDHEADGTMRADP